MKNQIVFILLKISKITYKTISSIRQKVEE